MLVPPGKVEGKKLFSGKSCGKALFRTDVLLPSRPCVEGPTQWTRRARCSSLPSSTRQQPDEGQHKVAAGMRGLEFKKKKPTCLLSVFFRRKATQMPSLGGTLNSSCAVRRWRRGTNASPSLHLRLTQLHRPRGPPHPHIIAFTSALRQPTKNASSTCASSTHTAMHAGTSRVARNGAERRRSPRWTRGCLRER